MKLTLDPMPALRRDAAAKVNLRFNNLAQPHRDAAHALKRQVAKAGAAYPDWFVQEAVLRSISASALAALVLSKTDDLAERELSRQRTLLAIEAAKAPADLSRIVDKSSMT